MKARNKSHALRQQRYRARKKWAAEFDAERIEKLLIDPHEQQPFKDYETAQQMLHTARLFARAFRQKGVECPEIQSDETIERFGYRVTRLWYSAPLGQILRFVSLKTCEFDPDQGFTNNLPLESFDEDWSPVQGSDVTVDLTALPPIAPTAPRAPAAAKKPECAGNSDACIDPTCLFFSWENEFARRRELEIKNIQKLNDEEAIKTQRAAFELSRTALPCVSFRTIDDL